MFQNLKADLRRYGTNLMPRHAQLRSITDCYGFQATAVYRFGKWVEATFHPPVAGPLRWILLTVHACLSYFICRAYGIRIDRRAVIGQGLYIGHFAGIVVGPCHIGENCSIHQHVRLEEGARGGRHGGPTIGHHVWIGAHSHIIGPVVVGNQSAVSAGSVVTDDVQPRALVVGRPARVVNPNYDNAALLGAEPEA